MRTLNELITELNRVRQLKTGTLTGEFPRARDNTQAKKLRSGIAATLKGRASGKPNWVQPWWVFEALGETTVTEMIFYGLCRGEWITRPPQETHAERTRKALLIGGNRNGT